MNSMNIVELSMENNLTPTSIRLDLKCGKSGIAKGKKCKKGRGISGKKMEKALALTGGIVYGVGAGAMLTGIMSNKYSTYLGGMSAMGAGSAVFHESTRRTNKRLGKKTLEKRAAMARNMAIGGAALTGVASVGFKRFEIKEEKAAKEREKNWEEWQQARGKSSYSGSSESYNKAYEEARRAQQERARAKANYNPFKDLGVAANASDADIQRAYRNAARANHPDVGGDPEKMKNINNAYTEIKRRRGRKDSADSDWELIEYDFSPPRTLSFILLV